MSKKILYIGNLPSGTDERSLRELFYGNNLRCGDIEIKQGYALVDCMDQTMADKALDKLIGSTFNGAKIIVEPSVSTVSEALQKPGNQ